MGNRKSQTVRQQASRPCSENAFCRRLSAQTRALLCEHCVKATYAANSEVPINFQNNFVVLEGLCLIKQADNLALAVRPGDFAMPPRFSPKAQGVLGSLAGDYQRVMSASTLQFLLPTTCVNFDTRTVEHLLDTNEEFLRVTFEALSDFCYQGVFYQLLVFHAPARDAVRYALNFCREYGVENPTHAQIALLTGRNRSTVTQAIHELALSDELPG